MSKDTLVVTLICVLSCLPARADQIVLINGDRLTGTILETRDDHLTLESDLLGLIHAPIAAIEEVLRDTDAAPGRDLLRPSLGTIQSNTFQQEPSSGPGRLWTAALDAGLSLTDGNADTRTVNVGLQAARTSERDRTSLYFTSLFASNSTSGESLTTANAMRGGGRYEIDLNPRLFTFGFSDLEFDRFPGSRSSSCRRRRVGPEPDRGIEKHAPDLWRRKFEPGILRFRRPETIRRSRCRRRLDVSYHRDNFTDRTHGVVQQPERSG